MSNWKPPSHWTEEELEHWKSLDHSMCTMMHGPEEPQLEPYERCLSVHTGPCRTAMPDERRRPVSARKPARWLIRRSASAWRWQIIDTHATEWADYVRLETITGAEAVAAFARGGR